MVDSHRRFADPVRGHGCPFPRAHTECDAGRARSHGITDRVPPESRHARSDHRNAGDSSGRTVCHARRHTVADRDARAAAGDPASLDAHSAILVDGRLDAASQGRSGEPAAPADPASGAAAYGAAACGADPVDDRVDLTRVLRAEFDCNPALRLRPG